MFTQYRRVVLLALLACFLFSMISSSKSAAQTETKIYLPTVMNTQPTLFGIEVFTSNRLIRQSIFSRAKELGAHLVRINSVSWRAVQPTPQSDYNWEALLGFEFELIAADFAGMTPIVVVDDSPYWATEVYYDANNQPYQTSCGAIKEEYFDEFAAFMNALVNRYKRPPYNVHYWEIVNEPDVDPSLTFIDSHLGCWGDIDDPYYGGEHYGNMLQAVTPAIKQADPNAQVILGGLLLAVPAHNNTNGEGYPERFFEGVLRAGAADSFDIVAYHAYSIYAGREHDTDMTDVSWKRWGGIIKGKAAFLRDVMARYDVNKPLLLNESGLRFLGETPDAEFFQAQADHVVRLMTRALSTSVRGVSWYTLNGPGWNYTSLLDGNQQPRPVYAAYQQFIEQTAPHPTPMQVTDYGENIEAYRFNKGSVLVDVLWSTSAAQQLVVVPRDQVVALYNRDGALLQPGVTGSDAMIPVGVSPIYLHRTP